MGDAVELSLLTSYLTCKLCSGYLIEATTIIECLHSFCKSCIVRYLDRNNKCPECQIQIHQSHPLSYIMLDRKMQDLVYRAVPGLQAREEQRIRKFYEERDLPVPDVESQGFKSCTNSQPVNGHEPAEADEGGNEGKTSDCNYHRDDEQISIVMQEGDSLPRLERSYLHCSIHTTIKTLKRYISQHLYGSGEEHNTFDIFCQKELMGKEHSLEFVLKTRWRSKEPPLQLEYRERVDVL